MTEHRSAVEGSPTTHLETRQRIPNCTEARESRKGKRSVEVTGRRPFFKIKIKNELMEVMSPDDIYKIEDLRKKIEIERVTVDSTELTRE